MTDFVQIRPHLLTYFGVFLGELANVNSGLGYYIDEQGKDKWDLIDNADIWKVEVRILLSNYITTCEYIYIYISKVHMLAIINKNNNNLKKSYLLHHDSVIPIFIYLHVFPDLHELEGVAGQLEQDDDVLVTLRNIRADTQHYGGVHVLGVLARLLRWILHHVYIWGHLHSHLQTRT